MHSKPRSFHRNSLSSLYQFISKSANITIEPITIDKFLHDCCQKLRLWVLYAPIYNIRRTFLHAQLVDLSKELWYHILADLFVPVLESLLDSIISIRILRQFDGILLKLLHHTFPIGFIISFLNYDLHHAKTTVICS
jgi:hypothetical protein